MNPELKKEWLRALRSGEYEQGRRYLCQTTEDGSDETFCCLGVLCDVGLDADWTLSKSYGVLAYEIHPHLSGILSRDDLQKLDLSEDAHGELMRMNDMGIPFSEIADWIEVNVR